MHDPTKKNHVPQPEQSVLFSLQALVEAEAQREGDSRRSGSQASPPGSGIVNLEPLRGTATHPTDRLVAPSAASTPAPPARESRWLHASMWGLGLLTAGVLGLAGATILRPPPTVVVQRHGPKDGSLSVQQAERAAAEGEATERKRRRNKARVAAGSESASASESEAESESDVEPEAESGPGPEAASAPTSASRSGEHKTQRRRTQPRSPGSNTRTASSSSLPDKLSNTQIRDGIASVKADARACGIVHGVPAGEKVTVRLSIDGGTGRVASASARAPHTDALGRCVAQALSRAKFPKFDRDSLGVLYSLDM